MSLFLFESVFPNIEKVDQEHIWYGEVNATLLNIVSRFGKPDKQVAMLEELYDFWKGYLFFLYYVCSNFLDSLA